MLQLLNELLKANIAAEAQFHKSRVAFKSAGSLLF
jgi:hypothetical protein